MNRDKDEQEKKIDPITVHLGDMGRYQFWFCMLIFLSKFPIAWVQLGHIFLAAPMKYQCLDPMGADPCSANCSKAEHNRSVFEETIVTEFGLVCGKAWLSSMAQTMVMLGIMCGNMAFGVWADKRGRRVAFLTAVGLQFVFGLIVSTSQWYWFFILSRFSVAFATGGTMSTGFILIMEILGARKREIMSILYQLPFMIGHAVLPLFSYFIRHWRWFNLSYSSICAVQLISICLCIESPRWYFTTGRLDDAIPLLEKIAKANGKPTENIRPQIEEAYRQKIAQSVVRKGDMKDLFRTPNLRMKTSIMAYLWLDTCMVYYGVSQYISTLSGNIFVNVAVSGILGSIGTIICVFMLRFMGRRLSLIIANFVSAISLLLIAVTPSAYASAEVGLATIGLLGSAIMFCIIYLYAGELFPTVVRNSGMGLCSFIGRVGSMIAPHISDLVRISDGVPATIFGLVALAGGLLTLLLPETAGHNLPETIEDGENFGKKAAKSS